jgi:putative tryptophan/tyrosine transport system substrate-binding protein
MAIHIRRREFVGRLGGAAAAWPLAARAEGERTRRIAVLEGFDDAEGRARRSVFRAELVQLGWTDGVNIRLDYRWGQGDAERIHAYATELVSLKPDAILVDGVPSAAALLKETRTIPIVMSIGSDPVAAGFVSSLARPGGNFTGFVNFEYAMAGKWLELLKEIAPQVTRVAVIHNPENQTWPGQRRAIEAVVPSAGVQVILAGVHDAAEIEHAIAGLASEPNGGVMVLPVVVNKVHRELILTLAAKHNMPAVYPDRSFATGGGLLSYGIDTIDLYRRAAHYIDRILRGEKPGDLPIQVPTKFELVINLKTARALGVDVPAQLLARADEVIE